MARNVLDLQGLPEGARALAARMMQGSCISVISLAAQAAQPREEAAPSAGLQAPSSAAGQPQAEMATSGWCVSVISYVSAE